MMKHRNIDAEAIRHLVREDANAARVSEEMTSIYQALDDAIKPFFITGKKLKGDDLRAMFEECCDRFIQISLPVDQDRSFRAPTRTRPKGEAYQARFVGVKRIENSPTGTEQYQLFGFSIFASRKTVILDFQEQPFAFQYHTAERLLERNSEKVNALHRLGAAVYAWSATILLARQYALKELDNRLVLPMQDNTGILLGDYIERSIYSGKRRCYEYSSCREQDRFIANLNFGFLARTFVSNGMLRDDQRLLMDQLVAWQQEFRDQNLASIRSHFWRSDMQIDRHDWSPFDDTTFDALNAIIGTDSAISTIKGRN